ncbi:hypothetical protein AAFC00_003835 [Neodothiora populina]|uniref:HlyIII-domain-containing protein n=1 Tax=Neodothiora populina TaxID=2781224 RepID=A0ABR3PFI2_9PEZI
MATATLTTTHTESHEEPTMATATSSSLADRDVQLRDRRRRHSSYEHRSWSAETTDDIQILVDKFITELGRRLDFLESYGHLKLDTGIDRAYNTLHTVHHSCTHVSDEVIDAGKRKAKIMVETLEGQYKGALARKETLEAKVREGVRLMEGILADFETRAYAMRDAGFTAVASDILDSGRRKMHEASTHAVELFDEGYDKARQAKLNLKETIDHAVQRAKEQGLITYQELPDPWRINPHILSGYRFSETKIECLRSVATMSNEFVNIWSHGIGLLIIISIAFYFYPMSEHFSNSTKSDIFVAAVFFFAAAKCLVCSTMWHTMNSICNQTLMERFACVDYTGISFLVASSIITTEYTAFYCEPVSRWIYMLTTAAFGIGGVILPWHPTFNRNDYAWIRVAFYVTLAATGSFPVAQLIYTRGAWWALYFYAPITKSLLVYIIGAFMYAAKIPERFCPGWFDYVGGSHNIWHFAVLGGILFHYSAMQSFFADAFRRADGQCSIY